MPLKSFAPPLIALAVVLPVLSASGEAVSRSDIVVVDSHTLAIRGERIRLLDFDSPELGAHAHCAIERMLAARSVSRLRQIINTGEEIDLQIVECSCPSGTEGTFACNWGRACGYLTVDRRDIGDILVSENLAHPYVCSRYSCPKRQPWCPFVDPDQSPGPVHR